MGGGGKGQKTLRFLNWAKIKENILVKWAEDPKTDSFYLSEMLIQVYHNPSD